MLPIFLTDLDHTFLRNDLTLSAFTVDTWNAKADQAVLSVATARSYGKAHELLGAIRLEAPMILLDGALVVDEQRRIIDLKLIDRATGDAVIAEGATLGLYPFVLTLADRTTLAEAFIAPTILTPTQEQVMQRNNNRERSIIQNRAMDENFKIVYMGDEAPLTELAAHLKAVFGATLEYKLAPEAYIGCYFLTVLHPLGDKAHGLTTVAHHLDRAPSTFTVFGDNFNDIGMFERAGTAVAVQNAQPEVKEAADVVLPRTNDEDAVAHYLKEH